MATRAQIDAAQEEFKVAKAENDRLGAAAVEHSDKLFDKNKELEAEKLAALEPFSRAATEAELAAGNARNRLFGVRNRLLQLLLEPVDG